MGDLSEMGTKPEVNRRVVRWATAWNGVGAWVTKSQKLGWAE